MQTVGGIIKPLQCTRRRYPKGTFTPQWLEPRARYIKLSSLPWKGTQDIALKEKRDNRAFLIIPYLFHNPVLTLASEVLWQAPHRWSITLEGVSLIIQVSELEVESPWVHITRLTTLRFIKVQSEFFFANSYNWKYSSQYFQGNLLQMDGIAELQLIE